MPWRVAAIVGLRWVSVFEQSARHTLIRVCIQCTSSIAALYRSIHRTGLGFTWFESRLIELKVTIRASRTASVTCMACVSLRKYKTARFRR